MIEAFAVKLPAFVFTWDGTTLHRAAMSLSSRSFWAVMVDSLHIPCIVTPQAAPKGGDWGCIADANPGLCSTIKGETP